MDFIRGIKGLTFVDVGAHVGRYTLRSAKNFDVVYAVEPSAKQRQGLYNNLNLNPDIDNVVVLPFGITDHNGRMQWIESQANSRIGFTDSITYESKQCFRLDFLVKTADWVKMDVEGHELEVLRGMTNMGRPNLIVEVHEFMDSNLRRKLSEGLVDQGYELEWLPSYGESTYLVARYV